MSMSKSSGIMPSSWSRHLLGDRVPLRVFIFFHLVYKGGHRHLTPGDIVAVQYARKHSIFVSVFASVVKNLRDFSICQPAVAILYQVGLITGIYFCQCDD